MAYGSSNGNFWLALDLHHRDFRQRYPRRTTMQDIASDATKFFSDGNNGVDCPGANTIENLVSLFGALSEDLTEPRLLPDNTT